MNIERKMTQIWIGNKPAPQKWMRTWKELHPNWQYNIFTQSDLESRKFKNQHLIDKYHKDGLFNGVSDLIRYELMYEQGGFFPEADSICLSNTEELFTSPKEYCYTCYEQEKIRPGYVQPILAANSDNEFLKQLIEELHSLRPEDLSRYPWESTGNAWLPKMISKYKPNITIWPSHFFIPKHYDRKSPQYIGTDKIYANHLWGSTNGGTNYAEGI
jgi:hypothetical protein